MITRINNKFNNNCIQLCKQNPPALSFKSGISIPEKFIFRKTEDSLNFFSMIARRLYNYVSAIKNQKQLNKLFYKILGVNLNSTRYIKILNSFARSKSKNREIEVNIEDKRIEEIAKSNDACIFIFSHNDGKKDPAMLGALYTLLTDAYLKLNKGSTCPRAKIIVNEDILKSMNFKQRTIYEKLGAVGVNANIFSLGKGNNSSVINKLTDEFSEDKTHIMLFPEGKMSMFKSINLKDKFQPGIGGIVNKSTNLKKHVKVIPVGFAYNYLNQNFLGSMHIGKPIYFISRKGQMYFNRANIEDNYAEPAYNKFFDTNVSDKKYFNVITNKGIPVKGKEVGLYIADILCENLRICTEKARQQLPKYSLKDDVIRI